MKKIQLKDYEGNNLYPVSKTKCIELPNGQSFHEYVERVDTAFVDGEPISRVDMISRNINKLIEHDDIIDRLYDVVLTKTIDTLMETYILKELYYGE